MIQIIKGAAVFRAGMEIDADGSPRAYAPPLGFPTLDYLANAGKPGNWFGLVVNYFGMPVVQNRHDPAPGYYISTTALVDHSKQETDPNRYVNSETIPYVVMPPELRAHGVHLGDIAMVCYGDKQCGAVVADIGPHNKYGEGSIKLAEELGINPSPKKGGCSSGVDYLIFPKSGAGWPRTIESIAKQAADLFATFGGLTFLKTIVF